MENKNIIIIAVAIIAIIAIVGVIFATGMLNGDGKTAATATTPFKTEFMEGAFVGNVSLENDDEKFMHSYKDKENKITYNISTVDDSEALMDIYYLQGVMNPEKRTFNGNEWNIYFTQAVEGNDTANENNTMNIIICQSQGEKQGYLIYMIIDAKSKVNATLNTYGESYTKFVEPLLESITLKESKHVPKIYEEFGLTEDQFDQQMDLIKEVKKGNSTAIQAVSGQ
jgi:Tfp pilus assembly protein PilE